MWITAKIGAQPYKGGKKGMDRGIDGYLHFREVKGGGIKPGDIRDLKGTMDREKAALGLFLATSLGWDRSVPTCRSDPANFHQ